MDMDTNMMLTLFKWQMNNMAAQIGNVDDNSGAQNNDNSNLMFALLLQAFMGGGSSESQVNLNTTTGAGTDTSAGNSNSQEAGSYQQLIYAMGQKYGVDPQLITKVIAAESAFNPSVTSSAGAQGLMQLMPSTAAAYGVSNPYDPVQNIAGGTQFLRDLLEKYNGNTSLALAAYNAGPGAVDKYNGVPPYQETQNYVKKIMNQISGYNWEV